MLNVGNKLLGDIGGAVVGAEGGLERGTEATDRGGDLGAGSIGADSGPALQPQHQFRCSIGGGSFVSLGTPTSLAG